MSMDAIDQFKAEIRSAGLEPPGVIEPDGKLRRFSSNGKRGDDSGWYVFHDDGIPAGAFGDWRGGLSETWRADIGRKLTPAEDTAHRARVDAMRVTRDAEQARVHAEAAEKAASIWEAAGPAEDTHPYLVKKAVWSYGLRVHDGALIVPVRDAGGALHSLQFISPNGDKRFLPGGRVKGCYFSIGKPGKVLCIVEGFATGASIAGATGHAVAVAFNAGNLGLVAKAVCAMYPDLRLILCADDDYRTEGNPGLTKATEAALAVGGLLAVPTFTLEEIERFQAEHGKPPTDLSDMTVLCGVEAVRGRVASAKAPVVVELGQDAGDGEAPDHHVNQPIPNPDMLYGLAGEVGRIAAGTTEVNEYAVAADFLAFLSAMVGRDVYLPVGNTWHHALLFAVHVGRSGCGRKGDALSIVHRIRHAISEADETLLGQTHIGGLSTREGLALVIHDGYKNGKEDIPPIDDKRLWVVESEFSNILHQGKRDGNTLSSALRDAWDGVSIRPAIKSARVWASDPHIAISGAITPSELLGVIEHRELTNGFASRILIFWSERKRLVAFPTATPMDVIESLARRAGEVIRYALGDYPMMKDTRSMSLADDARVLYAKLYRDELNKHADGPLMAALLERRAPMLLRLAMLFAFTDLTLVIGVGHIKAALAWVRYWGDSVRFIFSEMTDTEGAAARGELGEQIIEFLEKRGEADRTAIVRDCFSGHMSAMKIDGALDDLLAETPPQIKMAVIPRPAGQPGRGRKLYRLLIGTCEHSEDSEDRRHIRAELTSHDCEHSEHSSPSPDLTSQTSHGCELSESRASSLSSQHSQTSPMPNENADYEVF